MNKILLDLRESSNVKNFVEHVQKFWKIWNEKETITSRSGALASSNLKNGLDWESEKHLSLIISESRQVFSETEPYGVVRIVNTLMKYATEQNIESVLEEVGSIKLLKKELWQKPSMYRIHGEDTGPLTNTEILNVLYNRNHYHYDATGKYDHIPNSDSFNGTLYLAYFSIIDNRLEIPMRVMFRIKEYLESGILELDQSVNITFDDIFGPASD